MEKKVSIQVIVNPYNTEKTYKEWKHMITKEKPLEHKIRRIRRVKAERNGNIFLS
jgi:hypothetical protein